MRVIDFLTYRAIDSLEAFEDEEKRVNRIWSFRRLFIGVVLGCTVLAGHAQQFPRKLINLIVPYPAGGPSDYVARQLQPKLSEQLGQTLIVENVGGVGGAMGVQRTLTASDDGHTLLMATPMELVLAPLAFAAVKYRPEEFRLVAHTTTADMVLLARRDLPNDTVDDLIRQAKGPGAKDFTLGTLGPGSFYHLVGERFAQVAGIKVLPVPYKGGAPLLQDLLGGQIDLVFMPLSGPVRGMIQEGKVKAFGIASVEVNPAFPSIPALASQARFKDLEFSLWSGIAVRRGTPPEAMLRLNDAIYKALSNPDVQKNLESSGSRIARRQSLPELEKMYDTDIARYQSIARSIKLLPQ